MPKFDEALAPLTRIYSQSFSVKLLLYVRAIKAPGLFALEAFFVAGTASLRLASFWLGLL